jgi:integrase
MSRINFTVPRLDSFALPEGKSQAFLWDSEVKGLGFRVTPGAGAFVFQSEYMGKSLRITIGGRRDWSIPDAREKARGLQREIDEGRDPREVKRQAHLASLAIQEKRERESVLFREAWRAYVVERSPHWSARHTSDHTRLTQAGGKKRQRSDKLTTAGPLAPFMDRRLVDINAALIEKWALAEGKARPTSARLAARILKAFLNWCSREPAYSLANAGAVSKKAMEKLGAPAPKDDALLRGQLSEWFAAVGRIENPAIKAYLMALLLTGARREELLSLKWADVDFQWGTLRIRDKDASKGGRNGVRTIPLTHYVRHLIDALPRRNEWVFSSPTSASGQLREPTIAHRQACEAAGISLTIHGLRRSFATLSEWVEVPAGVVAQTMGHKPSATAERHYKKRPVDLLALWHNKVEAWILEQADISFVPAKEGARVRRVK